MPRRKRKIRNDARKYSAKGLNNRKWKKQCNDKRSQQMDKNYRVRKCIGDLTHEDVYKIQRSLKYVFDIRAYTKHKEFRISAQKINNDADIEKKSKFIRYNWWGGIQETETSKYTASITIHVKLRNFKTFVPKSSMRYKIIDNLWYFHDKFVEIYYEGEGGTWYWNLPKKFIKINLKNFTFIRETIRKMIKRYHIDIKREFMACYQQKTEGNLQLEVNLMLSLQKKEREKKSVTHNIYRYGKIGGKRWGLQWEAKYKYKNLKYHQYEFERCDLNVMNRLNVMDKHFQFCSKLLNKNKKILTINDVKMSEIRNKEMFIIDKRHLNSSIFSHNDLFFNNHQLFDLAQYCFNKIFYKNQQYGNWGLIYWPIWSKCNLQQKNQCIVYDLFHIIYDYFPFHDLILELLRCVGYRELLCVTVKSYIDDRIYIPTDNDDDNYITINNYNSPQYCRYMNRFNNECVHINVL